MNGLALRLAAKGGREAASRFALIGTGVSVGVVMLLFAMASINGLHAQDARWGWLTTSADNRSPSVAPGAADPLWWHVVEDQYANRTVERVDVAATGPRSPLPPGIPALPGPGEYDVSPALARLLAVTPAAELGDRFPGRQVGVIGPQALTSPDALIAIVGRTPGELARQPGVIQVDSIETAARQHNYSTFQAVALGIAAAGLLFPVLIFVGMATRIGAARREQRLAAMRLVGATPGQVAVIAAVEAAVAALAGTIVGTGLFWLLRPLLAWIPLTGQAWFVGDFTPGALAQVLFAVTVPAGSAVAAVLALRRVRISPLGVTRRVRPAPPRARGLLPLGLGAFILAVFALAGQPPTRGASATYVPTIVIGFVVVMAGLVAAGPWLTMICTRLVAVRTQRPAALIASRRLADDPVAAFRSVSGLILTVFVGSVLLGAISTATAAAVSADGPEADRTAITLPVGGELAPDVADAVAAALRSQTGVRGVVAVRTDPHDQVNGFPAGFVGCADLSGVPAIGRCGSPASIVVMPLYALDAGHTQPHSLWPAATVGPADLARLGVRAIVVATDGSDAALDRVRTVVAQKAPTDLSVPKTLGQLSAATVRDITQTQRMADAAIVISVLIAGAALAVSVVGGLIERRRSFSLLRLAGTPLSTLRRVVLLEAAVPLVGLTIISAAAGLGTAALLLRAVRNTSPRLPGVGYYAAVSVGLVVALAVVAATLPMLRRVSDPERVRTE